MDRYYLLNENKEIILNLAILTLILFNSFLIISFISKNNTPLTSDPNRVLFRSRDLYNDLINSRLELGELWINFPLRDPLFLVVPFSGFFLFGASKASYIGLNLIFSNLLLLGIFQLGSEIKNKLLGILAATVFFVTPAVNYSHSYLEEYVIIPFVLFSLFFLIKSKCLKDRRNVILASIFLLLASLFKIEVFIYALGPFFVYLFINRKGLGKRSIINVGLGLATILIALSIIYVPVAEDTLKVANIKFSNPAPDSYSKLISEPGVGRKNFLFSSQNILFYVKGTLRQTELLPFILLLIGIPFFIKDINWKKILIVSGWIIPYLFLTFVIIKNKNFEFIIPTIPFICLIIGYSLLEIKPDKLKYPIIVIVTSLLFFQFYLINFDAQNSKILVSDYNDLKDSYKAFNSIRRSKKDIENPYYNLTDFIELKRNVSNRKIKIKECTELDSLFFYFSNLLYDNRANKVVVSEMNEMNRNYSQFNYIIYQKKSNCNPDLIDKNQFKIISQDEINDKNISILENIETIGERKNARKN